MQWRTTTTQLKQEEHLLSWYSLTTCAFYRYLAVKTLGAIGDEAPVFPRNLGSHIVCRCKAGAKVASVLHATADELALVAVQPAMQLNSWTRTLGMRSQNAAGNSYCSDVNQTFYKLVADLNCVYRWWITAYSYTLIDCHNQCLYIETGID